MHGDVVVLGASSWRVEEIGHDRVTVEPGARACPGKLPFWHGDAVGRPIELGRALGRVRRRARGGPGAAARRAARRPTARLRETHDLDELAAENLLAYLEDEREATGALPTDRRIVVERFRDELGDWRLVPPDARSAAGSTRRGRWRSRRGSASGSGSRSRRSGPTTGSRSACPRATRRSPASRRSCSPIPTRSRTWSSGSVGDVGAVREPLPRERGPGAAPAAAPARDPDAAVAAAPAGGRPARGRRRATAAFPILVETYRECLVGRLRPARRCARSSAASRGARSPSTASRPPGRRRSRARLLFDYVAAYMYEGDAPLAERRAQALTLDRDLLRELLGQEELRELLDPDALADLELSLQALTDDRARDDRRPASTTCCAGSATCRPTRSPRGPRAAPAAAGPWLAELAAARRAVRARIAGEERWIAIEDVARYRDGVGRRAAARACPQAFLGPVVGRARRAARALRPDARPVPDARAGARAGACRSGVVEDALRAAARGRDRCCAASSGRAAPSASGATPRSCGCSGAARWRGCGARSSRSTRPRSPGSCPPGRASRRRRRRRVAARRSAARPPSSASPRSSTSSPGLPIPASVLERDVLPGAGPRLPAAAARRARRAGRGRLGRAGEPRPRRRPDRPAPAGPRGPAAARASPDGVGPPDGAAPRRDPRPPRPPRRLVLPRAVHARPAAARTARSSTRCGTSSGPARSPTTRSRRSARCAGSGRRADARGRRPGRLTALGPPEAAGRWSLVAPEAGDRRRADRAAPRPEPRPPRAARRPDPRGRRDRGRSTAGSRRSTRSCARWRRPAGSGAATSSTGSGPPSSRWPGALDRLRAVRDAGRAGGRPARSTSWPPPTRRTRTAPRSPWPRRGETDRRPLQRAAGAYVVLVDGVAALYLERGGSIAPDAARPPTTRPSRSPRPVRLRDARRRRPDPRARHRARSTARPVAASPFRDASCSRPASCAGYRGLVAPCRLATGPAR